MAPAAPQTVESSAPASFGLLMDCLSSPLAGATEQTRRRPASGALVVAPQQSWNSCRGAHRRHQRNCTGHAARRCVRPRRLRPTRWDTSEVGGELRSATDSDRSTVGQPKDLGRRRSTWSPLWQSRSPTPTFSATSTWWAFDSRGSATDLSALQATDAECLTRTGKRPDG